VYWPIERTATLADGQRDGVLSDLNFGEVFPFVAKPLAHDYLARYVGPLLGAQMAGLRPGDPIARELNPMAFVAGRPYMDLSVYLTIPAIARHLDSFESVDQAKGAMVIRLVQSGRLRPVAIPPATRWTLYWAYAGLGFQSLRWLIGKRTPALLLEAYRAKADALRALLNEPMANKRSDELLGQLDSRFDDDPDPTSDGLRHLTIAFSLHTTLKRLLTGRVPDSLFNALGQGIPHNFTTEISLDLWDLALEAKPLAEVFGQTPPERLHSALIARPEGQEWWALFDRFLRRHGHRGEVELDISAPRWREDPRFPLQTIANYLRHPEASAGPPRVLSEGAARREAAAGDVRTRLPWPLRPLFNWIYARYVLWMPFREAAKYTWLLGLEYCRSVYRELGRRLVVQGHLRTVDDVFWLRLNELETWARSGDSAWNTELLKHREEQWRYWTTLRPPAFLRDNQEIKMGAEFERPLGALLYGTPASSGQAEGIAKVLTDPHHADLRKGEILVTRYTDPAWTPLFFTASALITELGGVLSHGSVIAREVGLPAIVGVADATTRIKSGQRLRVDATEGTVELL
jgi:phosphohistidine swiveling domain-containing protein